MRRLLIVLPLLLTGCAAASATTSEDTDCPPTITETVMTDPGSPAVPPVTETIPAKAAIWEVWSPNNTQGPQDYVPSWPSDERGTWQAAADQIPPGHAGPDGVYQQGGGNSPYFYRQAAVPEQVKVITPGKEAVPPTFEDREVSNPDYPCETTPTEPTEPTPPVNTPPVNEPPVNEPPKVTPPEQLAPPAQRQAPQPAAPAAVPTSVDAGI